MVHRSILLLVILLLRQSSCGPNRVASNNLQQQRDHWQSRDHGRNAICPTNAIRLTNAIRFTNAGGGFIPPTPGGPRMRAQLQQMSSKSWQAPRVHMPRGSHTRPMRAARPIIMFRACNGKQPTGRPGTRSTASNRNTRGIRIGHRHGIRPAWRQLQRQLHPRQRRLRQDHRQPMSHAYSGLPSIHQTNDASELDLGTNLQAARVKLILIMARNVIRSLFVILTALTMKVIQSCLITRSKKRPTRSPSGIRASTSAENTPLPPASI